MSDPRLSVICTLGPRSGRADRVLKALDAQTAADLMEIVLIDAGGAEESMTPRSEIPTRVLPHRDGAPLGEARAAALHEARGEYVAFLADHVYPEPGWAEALIAAYREGSLAAIGYAFRNANPDTYGSRAAMLADFAPWLTPVRSAETDYLPPNDVSYRRSALTGWGDQLGELLTAEPLLLEELRGRGHRLGVAEGAVVSHGCLRTMVENAVASFDYCQALAGIQVRREGWGTGRRLAHALASAVAAPPVRSARTVSTLAGRSRRGAAVRSLPGILFQHLLAGLGQAWGYLAGGGEGARRFLRWELAAARDDR